jgi:acyl dehydratase
MKVGDTYSFQRAITAQDVADFAKLSGDSNPLHLSPDYAAKTIFGRQIVHGMFLGALCSQMVGMYLPGERCLYLSQDLVFKNPVFVGEIVEVKGEVKNFSESTQVGEVYIMITSLADQKLCVTGLAKVKVI